MNIVVIGATSAIASHVARVYAQRKSSFFLVARNEAKLQSVVDMLQHEGGTVRGVQIEDLLHRAAHDSIVTNAGNSLGKIDVVLVAHGVLPDQDSLNSDVDGSIESLIANALSPISIAHRFALKLSEQKSGSLVVLSSVAGDRGRGGNYAYGASKAAMSAYVAGLRSVFSADGVHIMTVKPGPVKTPMTEGKKMPLMANVDAVANDIVRGIDKKKLVVYTPGIWRFIMALFSILPERVVMRLKQ